VIYVNTDKKTGVAGGEIAIAGDATSSTKYANVYFVAKDAELAKVIFVDVNNNINNWTI